MLEGIRASTGVAESQKAEVLTVKARLTEEAAVVNEKLQVVQVREPPMQICFVCWFCESVSL